MIFGMDASSFEQKNYASPLGQLQPTLEFKVKYFREANSLRSRALRLAYLIDSQHGNDELLSLDYHEELQQLLSHQHQSHTPHYSYMHEASLKLKVANWN